MKTATTHHLGSVDQIPLGEGRAFAVAGHQIAVFRLRDGRLRALDAACPHRGGPLADGQIDCEVVICPLHAHTFNLTDGTSPTGQPPARTYELSAENGELLITF